MAAPWVCQCSKDRDSNSQGPGQHEELPLARSDARLASKHLDKSPPISGYQSGPGSTGKREGTDCLMGLAGWGEGTD